MNAYYYLIASLPYLVFNQVSTMSKDAFLGECKKWLSFHDLNALFLAGLDIKEETEIGPLVLKKWTTFNREFRERIGKMRSQRKENFTGNRGESAEDIFQGKDPLIMEMKFEKKRWDFIEETAALHCFDINYLVAYFLKLQINERIKQFDKDMGQNFFKKLCEDNYEQAKR